MFPQIPYGFQTNVRLYRANSTIGISNISVVSFVGEVRNALSSMGLRDVNSYTDLQLVHYADSLVGLNGIATQTYLNSVKQAQSIIEINPIITRTLLSRLSQATSTIDLTNVSTTATGSLTPSGQIYWRGITQDQWRGITQDEWRSIDQGSTSPWSPANITTQLWLDASDSATITLVSGAVSQWNDKSGNARNATQSASASRPTVLTANINGLDVLSFDGSDDWMETPVIFNAASDVSIFIVHFALNINSNGRAAMSLWSGIDSRNGYFHTLARTDITNQFRSTFVENEQVSQITSITAPSAFTINNWRIAGHGRSALNHFFSYDGVNQQVSAPSQCNFVNAKAIIGNYFSFSPVFYGWQGYIAEVIITSSYVSTDIRQRMEGYLAHKWGLTANLPSDHPYKTSPPTL